MLYYISKLKKGVAALLAAIMLLSLLPFSAYADADAKPSGEETAAVSEDDVLISRDTQDALSETAATAPAGSAALTALSTPQPEPTAAQLSAVTAEYTFTNSTVYLKDILCAAGLSVENNSQLSVDSALITISETTVKNNNIDTITLTASDYFGVATLTILKNKNKVQTLRLVYRAPEAEPSPVPAAIEYTFADENDYVMLLNLLTANDIYTAAVDDAAVTGGDETAVELLYEGGDYMAVPVRHFDAVELTVTTKENERCIVTLRFPESHEEETVLVERLLPEDAIWANDELYLTGKMPGNAVVEAKPTSLEINGESVIAAYDIKIYANVNQQKKNHPWQPAGDKVRVHFFVDTLAEELDVYHLADAAASPEYVDTVPVEDGWIEFDAGSFSVYAVMRHESAAVVVPRVEFHFIAPYFGDSLSDGDSNAYYAVNPYEFKDKSGQIQTTQILKNGESLELIQDPVNQNDKYFYGWYVVNPHVISGTTDSYGVGTSDGKLYYTWTESPKRISFERPVSISQSDISVGDTVDWSLSGVSGSGTVDEDGNVHVFLAPVFEKYHFVNFMQFARDAGVGGSASSLMTRKMLAFGSATSAQVKISDIHATSTDSVRLVFKGWEYNAGTETDPDWVRVDTVDYSGSEIIQDGKDGTYITVSDDVDLYPIFIEARWTDFNVGPTGNGANYIASHFLLAWEETGDSAGLTEIEGQSVLSSLEAPERKGYDFLGWYVGVTDYNADTGEFTTGTCITETAVSNGTVAVISGTTVTGTEGGEKAYEVKDGKLKFYEGLTRLTLYAKWMPSASNITIVYWTENAENDHYFSSAVKTITTAELNAQLGTGFASGSTITLSDIQRYKLDSVGILDTERLDDVGAVPAGEQIFYELRTDKSDASKLIEGEGNTLFNVYYNRKVFTLVFHIGRDGYVSTSGEQREANAGSWLQMFYNDDTAKSYDGATVPKGSRGASKSADVTMSYTHDGTTDTYTSAYETNDANILNSYVPGAGENVYTITAKFGAYIGDRWPSPSNPAFSFTATGDSKKEMYTWSAYYESRYCYVANNRPASDGQGDHPDINGIYNYMSAELCSNRDGTAIINDNRVHHLVAYFGDYNKAGVRKTYHILFEAIDGTYDPSNVTLYSGENYESFPLTTWTTNIAHADSSVIDGRRFYEVSSHSVISNLQPQYQMGWELNGYEYLYSCYDTPAANVHHIYFFYTPKPYDLTFKFEDEAQRKTD